MPYDEPEGDDPHELVGAVVPGDPEADEVMAECFVEEFALLGWPEARILKMFKDPFYRATHRLWVERGEAWVRDRLAAVRGRDSEARPETGAGTHAGTGTGTGTFTFTGKAEG